MLDLIPILEVTSLLTNKHTIVKNYDKSMFIACYRTNGFLSCFADAINIRLTPLVVRLTYDRVPKNWRDAGTALLKSASITCTTRDSIVDIVGNPVCLYSPEFEIYGRIRRSKSDRLYNHTTLSTHVSLSIQSITSISQCRYCSMRPAGKDCQSPSCHLSAQHQVVRQVLK